MKSLERFKLPWNRRVLREDTTEEEIRNYAKACLDTPTGELLLKHLIEFFQIDEQVGCIDEREATYNNGKQDALKYILSLITPQE